MFRKTFLLHILCTPSLSLFCGGGRERPLCIVGQAHVGTASRLRPVNSGSIEHRVGTQEMDEHVCGPVGQWEERGASSVPGIDMSQCIWSLSSRALSSSI